MRRRLLHALQTRRLEMLRRLGRRLVPGYRFRWPDVEWIDDEWFTSYLERFGELDGFNSDRRWALFQLAQLIEGVPGDTVECGAYRGSSSYLICARIAEYGGDRTHHVVDSFAGLSAPGDADGDYWSTGDLASPETELRANLGDFPFVSIHSGWIPEVLSELDGLRFALAHIDVDLYEPTAASIAFLFPKLAPGGILVCDDYGFGTCPGATRAMAEYFESRPEPIVSLPSGGAFVLKR